ncbi:MAG: glycosyltransferase family 39 protein [bacterium]|nr:glycosyltransferase family 39 protein [bacterium]
MTNEKNVLETKNTWTSDYAIIAYIASLNLLLHLWVIRGFGYFRDEFYYIACSDHLSFGYVDHPPLAMFLLKIIRTILGDSLIAIRLLPALGGAALIIFTGLIAKELGGKRFAILLASTAAFATIGNLFMFHYYSMNFLDILFWQTCLLILIRIVKTGNPKGWLLFGLIAGLGLQNKISVLFLCFGIFTGLLLTKERKHLKSKYLWIAAAVAGLLFLPYIVWNMAHGWPTLEFMHNAKTYKMSTVSPIGFLGGQMLYNNPITIIIWLVGLWYFLFNKEGKTFRLLGWMFLSIYILFTIQSAKDYYLAGAYPVLFAGGAILWEKWLMKREWNWPKPVFIVLILVSTIVFTPFALPVLSVDNTVEYMRKIGIEHQSGERHQQGVLPQHFSDMHGWEEMAERVARIYETLPPQDQKECFVFATNYGETGAINFYADKYPLPPAFSAHNSHYYWPPEGYSGDVVIALGRNKERLEKIFDSVIEAGRTNCPYAMPFENNLPIFICRGIKLPLMELWPKLKGFG